MKKFHEMTTEEKINESIFFKVGYRIGELTGVIENYGILDKYYKYRHNVRSELAKDGGRVFTCILLLNKEIAEFANIPEKIEIKTGAIKIKRDVFYKEKHTGNTVFTEPYEIMEGNGENLKALPRILSGFMTKQCEFKKETKS